MITTQQKEYQARWYQANKEHQRAANAAWKKNNPEKAAAIRRRAQLKTKYGITPEEFDALLIAQGNVCAICGTTEPGGKHNRFKVDHDHATGCVRGLLCNDCNIALGRLNDNIDHLKKAVQYLEAGGING